MFRKIFFVLIINVFIFVFFEISLKLILKNMDYPTLYKMGSIDEKNYNFLTGYYNQPNQKEVNDKFYQQATDQYGFNLDGERFISRDLSKKNKDTYRIFLLGGSTVQGRALDDRNDPISARLERELNKNLSNKFKFRVINAGTTSFISSQELALVQFQILYSLKPDHIIILNGTNDATAKMGNDMYISNSHHYQRQFQKNINKTSSSFAYFLDDWLSKNITIYFTLKKIFEKITGKYLFESESRKFSDNEWTPPMTEKRVNKYFYNINLFSELSNDSTYVSIFFQPQMLPDNIERLSSESQKIFNEQDKSDKFYFSNKQLFYDISRNKIKTLNNDKKFKEKKYFQFIDISKLLDENSSSEGFYSDWAHYTATSRDIIAKKIFEEIKEKIEIRP